MTEWINRFRRLPNRSGEVTGPEREIVREWRCGCAPTLRSHDVMVRGALRNANLDEFYLEDGIPAWVPGNAEGGSER